ncbi:MAG: hypothetical protein AB8C13_08510 [Phycisphaerales bacterium]
MSIIATTTLLLITTLILLQVTAFRFQLRYRLIIQVLIYMLCACVANSMLLANYATSVADRHAEQINALPDNFVYNNSFKASIESAKFIRKDTLALSLHFEPHNFPNYYDSTPSVSGVQFELLSPNDVGMFSRAPRYILGALLWLPSLLIGWMLYLYLNKQKSQS